MKNGVSGWLERLTQEYLYLYFSLVIYHYVLSC